MRKLFTKMAFVALSLMTLATPKAFARGQYFNYIQQGGATVSTSGQQSRTKVQRSFPGATIKVCVVGTGCSATSGNLITLFTNSTGTSKPNPFTAGSDGSFTFWTDATSFDIVAYGPGVTTQCGSASQLPCIAAFTWPNQATSQGGGGGNTFSITSFGAKCDGVTDDGIAIIATAAALQANGGGILEFPSVQDCRVYTVGQTYTNLIQLTGLNGVIVHGNGSRLIIDPAHIFSASAGSMFYITTCLNVDIRDLRALGTATASDVSSSTVKGVEFIRLTQGNANVTLDNLYVESMLLGVISGEGGLSPVGTVNHNIRIGNLDVKTCWYGFAGQYGPHDLVIDNLRTDTIHRSMFLNGGARSVRARIDSKDPKGSIDVNLAALNDSGTQYGIEDLDIEYIRRRDTASAGASTRGVALVLPAAASVFRNIRVKLDVKNSSTPGLTIFQFSKSDNSQYGSIMQNIEVSGRVEGTPSTIGGFPIVGSDSNFTWGSGDAFTNIRFKDLLLISTTYSRVYTNSFTGPLILDGVTAPHFVLGEAGGGDATPPSTGSYFITNSSFPEIYGTVGGFQARGLEYISLGFGAPTAVTVPTGWSGHSLTNTGNSGAISTGNLPPATVGLKYRLLRTEANALRLVPSGSEIIRGGGAGKYISLDTTGASVNIECFTAGIWDITYSNGTFTFQA